MNSEREIVAALARWNQLSTGKRVELLQHVASVLAGGRVKFYERRPGPDHHGRELWGAIARKGLGYEMELSPDVPRDQQEYVFLHECAHGRLHGDVLPDVGNFPSRRQRYKAIAYTLGEGLAEEAADELARRWQKAIDDYLPYETDPFRRLMALGKLVASGVVYPGRS